MAGLRGGQGKEETDLGLDVDTDGEDGDEDGLDVESLGLDVDTLRGDDGEGGCNADAGGESGHGCSDKVNGQRNNHRDKITTDCVVSVYQDSKGWHVEHK